MIVRSLIPPPVAAPVLLALLLGSPAHAARMEWTDKDLADKRWKQKYAPETRPYTPKKYPDHGLVDKMSDLGRRARGVWLTPHWTFAIEAERTARMFKRAGLNAVVVDIKDDWGQLLYWSKIPLAEGHRRKLIKDPKKLVETYHRHGIYVIGRVVCFKDSRLPLKRPDLSARIGKGGRRLFRAGAGWIDAYSAEVQDYLIDVARELEAFGFDEVQFDYVRFPKGRAGAAGVWLHQDQRPRATLIANFLERVDRALRIPLSVDLFGLTTFVDGDPRRLGQDIEKLAPFVEAISPMMYANGMTSYFKNNTLTEWVYSLIHCGLWRTRKKAPNVVLRPYLQAYANSVPFYGKDFITKQILAVHRAGGQGFLFWNPPMKLRTMFSGVRALGKQLDTFADNPERYLEKANRPEGFCHRRGAVFGR